MSKPLPDKKQGLTIRHGYKQVNRCETGTKQARVLKKEYQVGYLKESAGKRPDEGRGGDGKKPVRQRRRAGRERESSVGYNKQSPQTAHEGALLADIFENI